MIGPVQPDRASLPLVEDDLAEPGLIAPHAVDLSGGMPTAVVVCFFAEVIERLAQRPDTVLLGVLRAAHGEHALYSVVHGSTRVAVFHPGVGAPLAVGFFEEVVATGGRSFVAVGGAGALLPDLVLGHPVVVGSAVRDEGASFHYAAPGRIIDADPAGVLAVTQALDERGVDHLVGRVWTTDAFYREAPARIARRVGEDCLLVEMEAAALIAAARFRGVRLGVLLYAGDSVAGSEWDHRGWDAAVDVRSRLFDVAASAAVRLDAPGPV